MSVVQVLYYLVLKGSDQIRLDQMMSVEYDVMSNVLSYVTLRERGVVLRCTVIEVNQFARLDFVESIALDT